MLTGASVFGEVLSPSVAAATTSLTCSQMRVTADAGVGAYALGTATVLAIAGSSINANCTLTNLYGIKIENVSSATTLNYAIYTGTGLVRFGDVVNTTESYQVDGTKVLGNQGAAVADATDAPSVILRLNELLARCRAHGIVAT